MSIEKNDSYRGNTSEQEALMRDYSLKSIDTCYEKYGYWILHRENESAVLSHDTGKLIPIDDSQANEKRFFGNIRVGEFYLQSHDALVHYVAIHNDTYPDDIDAIGILNEDHIDFLERIPNGYPSRVYIIMLASKATLILSGMLPRKSVQQTKKE